MNRLRFLALTLVLVVLPLRVQAQDGGPYLTRSPNSHVEIKMAQWQSWLPLDPLVRPLSKEDSVRVVSGSGVRLHREEDHYIELTPGERYRVGDALRQDQGVLVRLGRFAAHAARTLSALIIQQPTTAVRTSHEFVQRSEDGEPPVLLFPAGEPPWPVVTEDLHLVWLPATSEADTVTQVRVYQGARPDACTGGQLVLETLVTNNELTAAAHSIGWTGGTRYRVELAEPDGPLYDTGCFVVATAEERATLEAQIAEVRRDLGSGTSEDEASNFDAALHVASLLVHEGYYYDAFLVLDGLLEQAPNDPGLRTIWGALLARTGVLDSPDDER